ncbi:MAG TPA: hypothetical protein VFE78_02240 [Gemmataceae bacterium]|jgi:hypothetical protein|nr:hypothetical protein [Gemmataceae bacterium]
MANPDGKKAKPPGIEFYGGYQVYSDSGVDLTMLRRNLERTVEERWESVCRSACWLNTLGPQRKGSLMFDAPGIVHRLLDQHVEFVVVGGLAMAAHGSTYLTKDLDVCYNRASANLAALVAALVQLHPYLRGAPPGLPFRLDVPTLQAGLNFTFSTDLGDLDLLGEVSGLGDYSKVFAQSQESAMFGMQVRVLSLDGLIAAKKAAGRNKDRNHLLELEELKKLREGGPG